MLKLTRKPKAPHPPRILRTFLKKPDSAGPRQIPGNSEHVWLPSGSSSGPLKRYELSQYICNHSKENQHRRDPNIDGAPISPTSPKTRETNKRKTKRRKKKKNINFSLQLPYVPAKARQAAAPAWPGWCPAQAPGGSGTGRSRLPRAEPLYFDFILAGVGELTTTGLQN